MPKSTKSTFVPKSMQATYEVITTLTDAFCREHLNEDYRMLAQRMTAALCRKRPSPFTSGQPPTWACGIVYVLGQINFLTDPSTQPFMTLTCVPGSGSVRARRARNLHRHKRRRLAFRRKLSPPAMQRARVDPLAARYLGHYGATAANTILDPTKPRAIDRFIRHPSPPLPSEKRAM